MGVIQSFKEVKLKKPWEKGLEDLLKQCYFRQFQNHDRPDNPHTFHGYVLKKRG